MIFFVEQGTFFHKSFLRGSQADSFGKEGSGLHMHRDGEFSEWLYLSYYLGTGCDGDHANDPLHPCY